MDKENLAFGDCGFRNVDFGLGRGETGRWETGRWETWRWLRHLEPGTWNPAH